MDMPCGRHGFEIDIESKWVYNHIKLRYDLNQNVMDDRTQFDMTANPP